MVYIKKEAEPFIYKNPSKIDISSNQASFRKNYLQEFIIQQNQINSTLKHASDKVNCLVNETKIEQQQQFNHVLTKLEDQEKHTAPLVENIMKQDEAFKALIMRFEAIDEFNKELMKRQDNEGVVNQAIIDQLTIQDTAIKQLAKKIELFGGLHDHFSDQLAEQNNINEHILKTLELQESFHKTILERLDHQEAINQKVSRDLDSLKATLFERISYVVEKIEENYQQITGFVTQLLSKYGIFHRITLDKDRKEKETIK
ncbi:hypothetical protein WQ54_19665 [Bacillus sp. SA1-12]|uniref:hypothetical protein n=1 Tax=Bacillus sp. SA1-12 TaxID=1455638 RepID=UPI000627417F|nr:hypothetical protein [Bacillus sp. SA1-12]KKI90209.1 hypothetical protein WQ54_19665 [Bacillus sp. SA1-12]